MRRQIFLEGRALYIIPCLADKGTRVPGGYKAAVADPASIARLFSKYPDPLIGVATGVINCIDVLDIDPRHGGERWFHENGSRGDRLCSLPRSNAPWPLPVFEQRQA